LYEADHNYFSASSERRRSSAAEFIQPGIKTTPNGAPIRVADVCDSHTGNDAV